MGLKDHFRIGVAAWDWIDRAWSFWSKLPFWLRTAVVAGATTIMTATVGFLAGFAMWLNGFVVEFWALALLSICAGAGAATAIQPAIERVGATLAVAITAKRTGKAIARPLSSDDKEYVQDFRTIWRRYGDEATRAMHSLFDRSCRLAMGRHFLAEAVLPDVQTLNVKRERMSAAVANDSQMPPKEVLERFHEMWEAYDVSMRWVARLLGHGTITVQPSGVSEGPEEVADALGYRKSLARWHSAHYAFAHALLDLHEKPAHNRVLKIFNGPSFDSDSYYMRFRMWADAAPSAQESEPDYDGPFAGPTTP